MLIGGGSWGTALAKILSDAGNQILWYMRNKDAVAEFNQHGNNLRYFPNLTLDRSRIRAIDSFHAHAENADILIVAVPAAFAEVSLPLIQSHLFKNKIVISAAKGMLPRNHKTLTEFLQDNWEIQAPNLFFIGGPCHAEEAVAEKRSYLTLAGNNQALGEKLAALFRNPYISCTYHSELRVVEFAAVLKNIYAVGMGLAQGLQYGDNFQAVLAANAWREAELFLNQTFPDSPINLNDSSCLGDLLVTCYSPHSRNRNFGILMAQGKNVDQIKTEVNMVAEGYYAVQSFESRYHHAFENMPICRTVFQVVAGHENPRIAFRKLEPILK